MGWGVRLPYAAANQSVDGHNNVDEPKAFLLMRIHAALWCVLVCREERARRLKQRRRQWLLKMYRTGMQGAAVPAVAAAAEVSSSSTMQAPEAARGKAAEGRRLSSSEEEQVLQQLEHQLLGQHVAAASTSAAAGSSSSSSGGARGVGAASRSAAAAADDDAGWDVDELVAMGLDAGILAWSQRLDFDSYQQHWASTAVTLGSEALVPESERLQLLQLQQQLLPV
jgi:hypothetical protein